MKHQIIAKAQYALTGLSQKTLSLLDDPPWKQRGVAHLFSVF